MRNLIRIASICTFLILSSIFKLAAQTRSGEQYTPPGFNPKKHILLVAEMPRRNNPNVRHDGVTKKLDKALMDNYLYKYEIVSMKDIYDSTKYSDTSLYKYALINTMFTTSHTSNTMVTRGSGSGMRTTTLSPSASTTRIDFVFYDRSTGEDYPESGYSSGFLGSTLKRIAQIINKEKGLE